MKEILAFYFSLKVIKTTEQKLGWGLPLRRACGSPFNLAFLLTPDKINSRFKSVHSAIVIEASRAPLNPFEGFKRKPHWLEPHRTSPHSRSLLHECEGDKGRDGLLSHGQKQWQQKCRWWGNNNSLWWGEQGEKAGDNGTAGSDKLGTENPNKGTLLSQKPTRSWRLLEREC